MLAITLARENQTSNDTPPHNEDSHFEVKVVNDGLFPEIRVSIVSRHEEKNKPKIDPEK